jgi:uncharacterized protein
MVMPMRLRLEAHAAKTHVNKEWKQVMAIEWIRKKAPTRDDILAISVVRPFAHWLRHGSLWHFNRRSVTRGVFVGLLFAFIIPFIQSVPALLLAVPMRANLAVVVLGTWVTNPLTAGFFTPAAYAIGRLFLPGGLPLSSLKPPMGESWIGWYLDWDHLQQASISLIGPWFIGTLVLGVASALIGYLVTDMLYRVNILRRWRHRRVRHAH